MSGYGRPEREPQRSFGPILFGGFGALLTVIALVLLMMWGCPMYRVYNSRQTGEAELAQAQFSRQVAVAEAKAKQEAAVALAAADTLRAHGVAESNRIIGQSLKQNDEYLTWLWIESLKEKGNEVIYVPTEANLPILEALRKQKIPPPPEKK